MGPCVTLLVRDMGGHQSAHVKLETQSRDGAAAARDLGRGVRPQRPVAPQHRLLQTPWHHRWRLLWAVREWPPRWPRTAGQARRQGSGRVPLSMCDAPVPTSSPSDAGSVLVFPDRDPENTRKHQFPDPAPCVRRRNNRPSRLCKHLTSPGYRGAWRCSNWGTLRKHIGGCGYTVLFGLSHASPSVCGSRMPKPARLWALREAAVNGAGRTQMSLNGQIPAAGELGWPSAWRPAFLRGSLGPRRLPAGAPTGRVTVKGHAGALGPRARVSKAPAAAWDPGTVPSLRSSHL